MNDNVKSVLFVLVFFPGVILLWMGYFELYTSFFEDSSTMWVFLVYPLTSCSVLASIYLPYYIYYIALSTKVAGVKNSKEARLKFAFSKSNPVMFVIRHKLYAKQMSLFERVFGVLSADKQAKIKSIYPEYVYHSWFSGFASWKNFAEMDKIVANATPEQIKQIEELFFETLTLKFVNIDNKKSFSMRMEPTVYQGRVTFPITAAYATQYPDVFEGGNFELQVKYKGLKGFSLAVYVK